MMKLVNLDSNSIKEIKIYLYLYKLYFLEIPDLPSYKEVFSDYHILEEFIFKKLMNEDKLILSSTESLRNANDIVKFFYNEYNPHEAYNYLFEVLKSTSNYIDEYYFNPKLTDKFNSIIHSFKQIDYKRIKLNDLVEISLDIDSFFSEHIQGINFLNPLNVYTIKSPLFNEHFNFFSLKDDYLGLLFSDPLGVTNLTIHSSFMKINSNNEAKLLLVYNFREAFACFDLYDGIDEDDYINELLDIMKLIIIGGFYEI